MNGMELLFNYIKCDENWTIAVVINGFDWEFMVEICEFVDAAYLVWIV